MMQKSMKNVSRYVMLKIEGAVKERHLPSYSLKYRRKLNVFSWIHDKVISHDWELSRNTCDNVILIKCLQNENGR